MKIRVIKAFTDKYTKEQYKIGQTLTVKEKRGKEILSSPDKVAEQIKED